MTRPDWAWQPDEKTQKAILSGNAKVRRASRPSSSSTQEIDMATKKKAVKKVAAKKATKKVAAKKDAVKKGPAKKLDGKKLAAQRKPRDSISQYIKDELTAGKKDVDKILAGAMAEFPGKKPTRGYVRWIAKELGVKGLEPHPRSDPPEKKAEKGAAKKAVKKASKKSVKKADAEAAPAADVDADVADPAS